MSRRHAALSVVILLCTSLLMAGDDANNPYELTTIAAKQAWVSLQRDLNKLDRQYERDRKSRMNTAVADLERAKAKAAQAANADEIVRINKAIEGLKAEHADEEEKEDGSWLAGTQWRLARDGRCVLTLKADHSCEVSCAWKGTWRATGPQSVTITTDDGGMRVFTFSVLKRHAIEEAPRTDEAGLWNRIGVKRAP
ncbi:MAG: hypothetical protein GC162_20400 [Planctomycetes bacterium]|nr:hypothetical protein [Planctomycetota bacterium]